MDLKSNPYYAMALDFIKTNDLSALETGKHVIYGDCLWVNICDSKMRSAADAKLEVHDKYIDVQVPLSKDETFGVKPRKDCTAPAGEMNVADDIMFFNDPIGETITVKAGETVVFAPETAHAPLIGEGMIHKAIFKVKVV